MEKRKCSSLTYIFCSDKYLLAINRQFLKHDYYTDIITFDLSSDKKSVIGEIYISTQRVRANAKELKLPIKDELLRVMIHGALHLCGYKDKSKTDKLAMRSREDYYIRKSKQAE
ncbi:MAG TPA: rRNA maturation RNase YbeY [Chitinophagaceae bacterium]|nr:rRNA maturation RNase YbeY [Chitinophagaceae bacterium]